MRDLPLYVFVFTSLGLLILAIRLAAWGIGALLAPVRRRRAQSRASRHDPAGPTVPEPCRPAPAEAARPAWAGTLTREEEAEAGPDLLPYSYDEMDVHDAHLRRAHFRVARGDIAGAIEDYREAERWAGPPEQGSRVSAFGMTEACDRHALLAGLDALLAACPDCRPALRERAYQRLCAGDTVGAVHDCNAVLGEERDDAFCRALRGLARRRSGDALGARHDLDAAVAAATPANRWPAFVRAGVALLDGAPGAALADLPRSDRGDGLDPYRHCLMDRARRRISGVALAYPVPPDRWETLHRLFGPGIAT